MPSRRPIHAIGNSRAGRRVQADAKIFNLQEHTRWREFVSAY
jgi:hypothetical protein